MYIGLKHLHSLIPYLLLPLLLVTIILAITGFSGKKAYGGAVKKVALFSFILSHIMLLVGLILYFVSPITQAAFQDFGAAMKDSTLRLYAVEHISTMLIAIVLLTIGYGKAKRNTNNAGAHKQLFWFYTFALILMLSRIPWQAWL